MKKKRLIGTLLASSIAVTAAFTGCSLVTSNNNADMLQVIATVNISEAEGLNAKDRGLIDTYKSAVGTTKIYKNELVAYYLNYGISYINQGYPASTVFNMLVDNLVQNAVLTQYATMYVLDSKIGDRGVEKALYIDDYNQMDYIEQLEYLLTDEDAEDPDKEVKIAKYSFYSVLNATLDSFEQRLLGEDNTVSGTGSRATPSGVDTEQEDFYPAKEGEDGSLELDYNVYTGYKGYLIEGSGDYKKDALDGTNRATRARAYNNFIGTLISNGLIDPDKDDLRDVTGGIEYMEKEYATQLENRVINKYYDLYEAEQEEKFSDNGEYEYLDKVYKKLLTKQENSAEDSFESDIDNMSDNSFVLYSPKTEGEGTYGFVYNILLPFSAKQNSTLSALKSNNEYTDDKTGDYTFNYYVERNKLLKQITTIDQREAWFNGITDYAFNAADAGLTAGTDYYAGEDNNRQYLFFENNVTKTNRYESLNKYIGKYAYNGRVQKIEDGSYVLDPEKLTIDGMLTEFKEYINFVLDGEGSVELNYSPDDYYAKLTEDNFYTEETRGEDVKAKDKKIDFNNFIYAEGTVNLNNVDVKSPEYRANIFNKTSSQYKALAAVNELQYAYTTDTGVLSQYLGYDVTLGDTTGYIKEFETAAQAAIENGPGSFNVCAGDYGWHLVYVVYTFEAEGGAVYGEPNWKDNVGVEGTFENFFYEWVKSNNIKVVSTTRRTQIMAQFNTDTTVNKIQSAYQDLLDLG